MTEQPTALVHEQPKSERSPREETLASYRTQFATFLHERWDESKFGKFPMEKPTEDFVSLGAEGVTNGIHELNTERITPDNLRALTRVLDAMHTPSSEFQTWVRSTNAEIPTESWLHKDNPKFAQRGKEWWTDRLTELTKTINENKNLYNSIDPNFPLEEKLGEMIRNNFDLYPHTDGTIDKPALAADAVVIHGALYPATIRIHTHEHGVDFSVGGGDRAQGYGLRGHMIDWLVTSAAASPDHQLALIDEFLTLHPSDKDKRGLAMQLMYRSVMELPWFLKNNKPEEVKNLARLTYDIVKGNGVWAGVNTPLAA